MAPKKKHGRASDVPEWQTASAARLDNVRHEFGRQALGVTPKAGSGAGAAAASGASASSAAPDWLADAARRRSRSRTEQQGTAALSHSIEPTAIDVERSRMMPGEMMRGVVDRARGVEPRALPQDPQAELAALRLGSTQPHSFAPWRHTVMVCGRPVVVLE